MNCQNEERWAVSQKDGKICPNRVCILRKKNLKYLLAVISIAQHLKYFNFKLKQEFFILRHKGHQIFIISSFDFFVSFYSATVLSAVNVAIVMP